MEEYLVTLLQGLLPAGHWAGWGDLGEGVSAPFIVVQQISGDQDVTSDGPDQDASARLQIDVFCETPDGARDLGLAVLALLNGHAGGPIETCFNLSIRASSAGSGSAILQRRSLDFAVTYRI